MKKVLALVLAVVLAFGMSSVAFAAVVGVLDTTAVYTWRDYEDLYYNTTADAVAPGSTTKYKAAVIIDNLDGSYTVDPSYTAPNSGYASFEDCTIKVVWTKGGDAVDYFRLKDAKRDDGKGVNKPAYLELKLKENYTLVDAKDLAATITRYHTDPVSKAKTTDIFKFTAAISNASITEVATYATAKEAKENGYFTVDDNTVYIAEDKAGYVAFGDEKRLIQVVAKASKKQKMFLYFNEDIIAEVSEKYEDLDAQIAYYNLPAKPEFSKATVTIDCDFVGKPYLYEYNNGKLTKIDAKWDNANGTYTFDTKVLTSYVVSDKELVTGTDDGTVPTNPDTGANDFVGLAVALAVVSVAGIAVAKRK